MQKKTMNGKMKWSLPPLALLLALLLNRRTGRASPTSSESPQPPLTCAEPNKTDTGLTPAANDSSKSPCWKTPVTVGEVARLGFPKNMPLGSAPESLDPTSNCTCQDYEQFEDPFMGKNCPGIYDAYLKAKAPDCIEDSAGYVTPHHMLLMRNFCPLSCGICQIEKPSPSKRDGVLRGNRHPMCSIASSIALPEQEESLLEGVCTLCSNVTIQVGGSLRVQGVQGVQGVQSNPNIPSTISGGDASRHFVVFGELILEDVVLQYGFSGENGGSILVDGTSGNRATMELIRSAIVDCAAQKNGGAVAAAGPGAVVYLRDGARLERNGAENGGGLHISQGASLYADLRLRAPETSLNVVHAIDNHADSFGGFLYLHGSGTQFNVSGRDVNVLLRNNVAGAGGAIAGLEGAAVLVEKGARLTADNNIASSMGGAVIMTDEGSRFEVRGTNTRVDFSKNLVFDGMGGAAGFFEGAVCLIASGAAVNASQNNARQQGAHILVDGRGAILRVSGEGTKLLVRQNFVGKCEMLEEPDTFMDSISKGGGGLHFMNEPEFIIEDGAFVEISGCTAEYGGGGLGLVSNSLLTITGTDSKLVVRNNRLIDRHIRTISDGDGGGIMAQSGSRMSITDGGYLEVLQNFAHLGGGIILDSASHFEITGEGSLVLIERNSGTTGGGILSREDSSILVQRGAKVVMQYNSAHQHGGGMASIHGTSVIVKGTGTSFVMRHNVALAGSGGGLAVFSIASVNIDTDPGKTIFESNSAPKGTGGAVAFVTSLGEDGSSSCVPVILYVQADVDAAFFPASGPDRKPR